VRPKPPLMPKVVLLIAAMTAGWTIAQDDPGYLGVVAAWVVPAAWLLTDCAVTIGWRERLEREDDAKNVERTP
jgi:hypothetical protein